MVAEARVVAGSTAGFRLARLEVVVAMVTVAVVAAMVVVELAVVATEMAMAGEGAARRTVVVMAAAANCMLRSHLQAFAMWEQSSPPQIPASGTPHSMHTTLPHSAALPCR
jgi:hypothetical protein